MHFYRNLGLILLTAFATITHAVGVRSQHPASTTARSSSHVKSGHKSTTAAAAKSHKLHGQQAMLLGPLDCLRPGHARHAHGSLLSVDVASLLTP